MGDTFRGDPILEVDRIEGNQSVTEECPGCGETHRHGVPGNVEYYKMAHRMSHCGSGDVSSYWLVFTPGTKNLSLD